MLNKTADELRATTEKIFVAAGAPQDLAQEMGEALVGANLAGHDSHGVIRIPAYINLIKNGGLDPKARPTIVEETATTALVDGNWTFGHVSAKYATNVAIKKAKESKTAVVSVVRCNHIGRLGQWASQAAAEDVIAMVMVGGGGGSPGRGGRGSAAPFGGAEPAFSTNPIAIGIPGGETPDMLIDFATTVVAEGKIQVARAKGTDLPPGCILDKDGKPSVNPHDFYNGGVLLPFGGHKGYALAMFVEMLCGAFTPGDTHNGEGRRGGAVVWAVDAHAFRGADYEQQADFVLNRVKGIRPAQGFDRVMIPGEPELGSKEARLKEGIPVAEATWDQILEAAKSVGVTL